MASLIIKDKYTVYFSEAIANLLNILNEHLIVYYVSMKCIILRLVFFDTMRDIYFELKLHDKQNCAYIHP